MVGDKEQLKILVITSEPFPIGLAATNRIRTYTKGLTELNQPIEVLSLKSDDEKLNAKKGEVDSYKYRNFGKMFSYNEILAKELKVLDGTAVTLCKENSLKIKIFNITKKGNIIKAVTQNNLGTLIQ